MPCKCGILVPCCFAGWHLISLRREVASVAGRKILQDGKCIAFLELSVRDSREEHPPQDMYLTYRDRFSNPVQPKQIQDIKEFLMTARRDDAKMVTIKKLPKGGRKFKVRCSKV